MQEGHGEPGKQKPVAAGAGWGLDNVQRLSTKVSWGFSLPVYGQSYYTTFGVEEGRGQAGLVSLGKCQVAESLAQW